MSQNIDKVTVCLTSCNRFDLLDRTLDNFFKVNTYPIDKFLITEDSTLLDMKNKIESKYGSRVELIFNETNLGLYKSIDNMYSLVNTEYIFHMEDDWIISGNSFIADSLDILNDNKGVNQVWIRSITEFPNWVEPEIIVTKNNTKYKMMKKNHLGTWGGFSFNPGLRRKSDYIKMFPNGYSEFSKPNVFQGLGEYECNNHAMDQGYRAAILLNTKCVHIGGGRTTLK
jgi:hypothetical protein